MKIIPSRQRYVPLDTIYFGRGGLDSRLIYKALDNGDTSQWWYGDDLDFSNYDKNFWDLSNIDISSLQNESTSPAIRTNSLTAQAYTDLSDEASRKNAKNNREFYHKKWAGDDNTSRIANIEAAYNIYKGEHPEDASVNGFVTWYNTLIKNSYEAAEQMYNTVQGDSNKSPYIRDKEFVGTFNKNNAKLYSIPNKSNSNSSNGEKSLFGYNKVLENTAGITTYSRFIDANEQDITNLEFSGDLKDSGIVLDKSGALKIAQQPEEPEVTPETPEDVEKTPKVKPQPDGSLDETFIGDGYKKTPTYKINWWDKLRNGINESLPTLMDIGLLWNTLRNNNKNRRDLLKAWHPTLQNTYERYSPVTGSYAEMALYNQMAAETNRRADRNATADAQLNLANRLESNRLANLYREKGFLADNAQIEKTALAALGRLEDNMARRADIANKNAASINETNRERALIKVSNRQANTDTLNNFFKNTLNRKDTREAKEEYYRDKLLTNLISNWYQNQLNNLDAAWEEYATSKEWNPYNSTLKSQNPLYRAFILTINENAAALSNMQLLGYFPLSNNLSHFNPYLDFTFKDSTTESKRLGGKINRLLRGGGFSQFFTVALFQSPSYSAPKEKAASASTSKKDDLGLTDIMSLLKSANMLPNEERELLELLQGDLTIAKLTGQGISNIASRYVLWIGEIHNGNFNKTLWSEAKRQAEKNDALNDLSILPNGNIIVLSTEDGELHTLTPAEYALTKGTGLFVSITNDQLLWLRSLDPNYINNNNVFLIINNGIGLKTIYKMIKDNINLAIEESTSESFYRKPGLTAEVRKGLEDLVALGGAEGVRAQQMLMREYNLEQGPNGVYKITDKNKGVSGDKLQAALHYIWSMLPANAKSRLIAETSSGSEKEALTLIALYMIAGLPTETSETYDYLKEAGMHGGTGAGSGSDGDVKTTRGLLAIFRLGETGLQQFNFGSSGTLNVIATRIPNSSISGRNLTNATMQEFLLSELGLVVKSNGASIGGKEINASTFPYIIMKGNDVFVCKFPAVPGKNGEPVPNITAADLENIKKADEEVRKLGVDITNLDSIKEHYLEVNDIYRRYNLPEAYGSDGLLSSGWAEFVIANIYFDKNTMDIDELSRHPLVRKIGGKEETNITNAVNLGIYNSNLADSGYFKKGNIYEGLLWMPLNTNLISAARDNEKRSDINNLDIQGQATEILNAARRSVVDGSKNLNE